MEILIGTKYKTEFESAFRLILDCPTFADNGYKVSGDIDRIGSFGVDLFIRDGKNEYAYDPSIPNAQFKDDEDDETSDEIGFELAGASWFRGVRGGKSADSADAHWMQFIEKAATLYHKKYSIVEYKQQKKELMGREEAFSTAQKLVKFLWPDIVLRPKDLMKVTDEDVLKEEAEDIYGLSLRLALNGGTGQSERVLGKVYFRGRFIKHERRIELVPLLKREASAIDKTLSNFRDEEDGEQEPFVPDDSRVEMLTNNALNALEKLIESSGDEGFVDSLLLDEKRDQPIVDTMLELTAHKECELQCDELKVLGISHVQWDASVFDCMINGAKKLRFIFGLNNTLTVKCLNCADSTSFIVKDNALMLVAGKPHEATSLPLRNVKDDNLGFSTAEIATIKARGAHKTHLKTVVCQNLRGAETCKCVRCQSQLFTVPSADKTKPGKQYCKDCRYPEIVYFDPINEEEVQTTQMRFSVNDLRMIKADALMRECSCCGRNFSVRSAKKEDDRTLCPLCELTDAVANKTDELSPEEKEEAKKLYKQYAQILSVWKRAFSAFKTKYCFEDERLIVFVVGKKQYRFDKLGITEHGYIDTAKRKNRNFY